MSARHSTVRLSPSQHAQLIAEAHKRGCSPAHIIRVAVEQYILGQSLLTDSQLRLIRVGEYSQLALDTIITEQFPDFRDRIITSTDNRMRRFHCQD